MADCMQGCAGSPPKGFTTLDMGPAAGVTPAAAPKSRMGAGTLVWLLLLTATAIAGLVLGAWATSEVKKDGATTLYTKLPTNLPSGYSAYSLGTGLGYWSPTEKMLHPRSDMAVVSYDSHAYLIGGLTEVNGNAVVLNSTVRYNLLTGESKELKAMPQPRQRFAYALLNGEIYIMGGTDSNDETAPPLNSVFIYNIAKDEWRVGANLAGTRSDGCASSANGKMYVFGGYNLTDDFSKFPSLHTVEEYDPAAASPTWVRLPASSNLKVSRGDCRAAAVNNKIYAVGGVEYYEPQGVNCTADWVLCYRFLDTVEAFDPVSKTWSMRASMLFPRGDFGIEVLPGGRILVAGGERSNGLTGEAARTQVAMYDVEEYVAEDNVWMQKGALAQARFRADLAYFNNRAYVFGGVPMCAKAAEDPNNACSKLALDTVFGYFDIQYPHLYAMYKPATTRT